MAHYCDSSVLCKAFVEEAGSTRVRDLLAQADELVVSRLGLVEVAAGLCRAGRDGRLPQAELDVVRNALEKQSLGPLRILDVTAEACATAVSLVCRYPLRGADALHLATALTASAEVFVCSDERLLVAAASEGLKCINPVVSTSGEDDDGRGDPLVQPL